MVFFYSKFKGLLHCINEISQKKVAVENVDQQTKVPFDIYVWLFFNKSELNLSSSGYFY